VRGSDGAAVGPTPNGPGSGEHASGQRIRFANPRRLAQVDSTNRYLRDAALEGGPEGLVVVADEQVDGRGRRARSWVAPSGSALLCSILFRPRFPPDSVHLLPTIVGLAALDALGRLAGGDLGLKWPNDLVAGEEKLGGILGEIVAGGGDAVGPAVVVGLGINLAWPPGWPPEGPVADALAQATTVERLTGVRVDRDELAAGLIAGVERRYPPLISARSRAAAIEEYRDRCTTISRTVRVELDGSTVEGVARDIAADGRLVVECADGSLPSFDAGDVVHLRGAPTPDRPRRAD